MKFEVDNVSLLCEPLALSIFKPKKGCGMDVRQNTRKRRYQVKATKDFLVLSLIFFFLGLWAIRDGWFPSEKTLKKHPQRIEIPFEIGGTVDKILIKKGDEIFEKQGLILLNKRKLEEKQVVILKDYTVCRKKHDAALDKNPDSDETKALKKELSVAKEKVDKIREEIRFTEVRALKGGTIVEVGVEPISLVKKGDIAVVIAPKDHFYPFNKALTFISIIAFFVFLFLHIFAT